MSDQSEQPKPIRAYVLCNKIECKRKWRDEHASWFTWMLS